MAHHTHLKVGACTGAVHPPRWAMENVFDFLDDASLCVGLGCCRAWHACGTEGAWAAHAWASRGECAVVGAAARPMGHATAPDYNVAAVAMHLASKAQRRGNKPSWRRAPKLPTPPPRPPA